MKPLTYNCSEIFRADELPILCRSEREKAFVSAGGSSGCVVGNAKEFGRRVAVIDLIDKLSAPQIAPADDFDEYAEQMKEKLYGK